MDETITVIIDRQGKVTVDAVGFQGGSCEAATKAIEDALGAVSARAYKPEFYTEERHQTVQRH